MNSIRMVFRKISSARRFGSLVRTENMRIQFTVNDRLESARVLGLARDEVAETSRNERRAGPDN